MGLEQSFSSMKAAIIVLAVVHLISGATYKETRKVTDSNGKKFSCTYNIFYNSKTVVKSKSSVTCSPNTNGKAISEIFVIESLGKSVTLKHAIRRARTLFLLYHWKTMLLLQPLHQHQHLERQWTAPANCQVWITQRSDKVEFPSN